MSVTILQGDAIERMREMPDESVHCIVTSPPYFGLRDYEVDGQIGLEETPSDYVAALVAEICIRAGCPREGTILDPFGGAGTSGLVADRLRRNAILIELNPDNAEMARRRVDADASTLLSWSPT